MRLIYTEFGAFNVFKGCDIGREVEKGTFWEPWTRKYFDEVEPGSLFVDAGANFGFYSVYMARKGCKVVAFEPCREVFGVLEANIRVNLLDPDIEAHRVALWDGTIDKVIISRQWLTQKESRIKVADDGESIDYELMPNSGGMSVVPGSEPCAEDKKLNVFDARSLDSYQLWRRPERVGLIKIDCQGADLRVLKGAVATIDAARPLLLFEYEPMPARHIGDSLGMCLEFLEQIGYLPEVLKLPQPKTTQGADWRQFGARPV